MSPLTRDGHLLDLTIDLYMAGDLSAEARATVDQHRAGCAACARRWALAEEALAVPLPPLRVAALSPIRTPAPAPSRGWGRPLAFAAALAAGLLLALFPEPPPAERFVARGGASVLEVFRATEQGAERVHDGSLVAVGDRLGFRVHAPEGGWFLVFGVDAQGRAWPAWPQGEEPAAAHLEPSFEPVTLSAAVALDDSPGSERVYGLRCARSFSWSEARRWAERDLPAGCALDQVRLDRRP